MVANEIGQPYISPQEYIVTVSIGAFTATFAVWGQTELEAVEAAKGMFANELARKAVAKVKSRQG
jgi:hypothetical protein